MPVALVPWNQTGDRCRESKLRSHQRMKVGGGVGKESEPHTAVCEVQGSMRVGVVARTHGYSCACVPAAERCDLSCIKLHYYDTP